MQFDTLFTDGLYFEISKNAIDMAEKLRDMFISRGYSLFIDSPTNQQFIIIEDSRLEEIKKQVRYDYWERYDEMRSVVRFATSWATTDEDLKRLGEII